MKKLIIVIIVLLICFLGWKAKGQTHLEFQLDPMMLIEEDGLDITFAATTDQRIFGKDFRFGALLEMYSKRQYYGAGLTLDYPIDLSFKWNISGGVELGYIFRQDIHLKDAYKNMDYYFLTYGFNGKVIYWLGDSWGLSVRGNYKLRSDVYNQTFKDSDKWRFSSYGGIVLYLN
jgi:hypothetical protein